jgi:uncharacterized protein YegJ (DUF2314 family)
MERDLNVSELIGKTLTEIQNNFDEIIFTTDNGDQYKMYHSQDCCESVGVEDIIGDLSDLIGSAILEAEEVTSSENPEGIKKDYQDSFTWTFYKLGTIKGSVTIRWYGESNGYYSESVEFCKV